MKKIFLIVSLMAAPSFAAGQKGTVGASFLKLGAGARALALGEAYSAAAGGAEALYWNPAGLLREERPSVMLAFNPLVEGVQNNQAAFAVPFKKMAFGLGYNGLTQSTIDGYDAVGNKTEGYAASDQMGILSVAVGGPAFSVGVSGKYWRSSIDNVAVGAAAGDAGLSFENPFLRPLRHAVVVRHVGSDVAFIDQKDPLPLTYLFGNALRLGRRFLVTADVGSQKGEGSVAAGGVEWSPLLGEKGALSLRGGYSTRRNDTEKLGGASFGIGLIMKSLSFDYAWIPYGELGDGHAITLVWRIPKFERRAPAEKTTESRPAAGLRKQTLDDIGMPEDNAPPAGGRKRRSLGTFEDRRKSHE